MKTATALRNIIVTEYNVKTHLNNRGRKPITIPSGTKLSVLNEFVDPHGEKCLKLQANSHTVYVMASDFQVEEPAQ